ncbi:MAG: SAM-dependent methyltransferase, partial [Flavihumibacter sp.]|nr:SAM-dependent methyltransferase [Flavihumibacter sp.]
MERILEATADGSHTISIPEMQVTYHSKHGAVQESMHVFIEAGLRFKLKATNGSLAILEMGFGTGLNALLTLLEAEGREIWYESLEAYPVSLELAMQLNYAARSEE